MIPSTPSIRTRCPRTRLGTAAAALLAASLVAGCASTPETVAEVSADRGENLYDGLPETVYATEFPIESAADARARAEEALDEGDVDRALYMYVEAVKLEPEHGESLYRIGAIHERKGNLNLAARAYRRAIDADPEHGLALQGLGHAYFESREPEQAREMLERAVAVDPRLWRAHNMLGVIADTSSEHEAAVDHYSAALEIRPGAASLLNNRGYSRYLAGDYEAAEEDFRAALDADAEYERAWRNLGLLHARQREYGLALRALSRVMSRHAAANDVGYIAMLDEDYDAAETLFSEAKRASPRYYEKAEQNLAQLRRRRDEGASAAAATGDEEPDALLSPEPNATPSAVAAAER